jgi:hypothetical protein
MGEKHPRKSQINQERDLVELPLNVSPQHITCYKFIHNKLKAGFIEKSRTKKPVNTDKR